MATSQPHPFPLAPSANGQNSNAKRLREDDPVQYAISLDDTPGAGVQVLSLDTVSNMSHISQWNDQLSRLVLSFQERMGSLASEAAAPAALEAIPHISTTVPLTLPHTPNMPVVSPSVTVIQSGESHARSESPERLNSDKLDESDSHSDPYLSDEATRVPISERLGRRVELPYMPQRVLSTATATGVFTTQFGRRSTMCESDYRHRIRRVYTLGLMKPKSSTMRQHLEGLGVDPSGILYSHHIAYTVNEFIVKVKDVTTLSRELGRLEGVQVMRFFDPLDPVGSELTYGQEQAFPGRYRDRVRCTFVPGGSSREGFLAYALDYRKEIGVDI